jgi:hypothetical protein
MTKSDQQKKPTTTESDRRLSPEAKWLITKFLALALAGGWAIIAAITLAFSASTDRRISETTKSAMAQAIATAETVANKAIESSLAEHRQEILQIKNEGRSEIQSLRQQVVDTVRDVGRSQERATRAAEDAGKATGIYAELVRKLAEAEKVSDAIENLASTPESVIARLAQEPNFVKVVAERIPPYPPGTIVAYLGRGEPPKGWLYCDGTTPIPETSKLREILQRTTTPDLRGMFLRGAGQHPDYPYAGGDKRLLGSPQDYATAQPKETPFKVEPSPGLSVSARVPNPADYGREPRHCLGWVCASAWLDGGYKAIGSTEGHSHPLMGGSDETRPRNVAVNWIIKE